MDFLYIMPMSLDTRPKAFNAPRLFTTKQWFFENLSHIIILSRSFLFSLSITTRKLDRG